MEKTGGEPLEITRDATALVSKYTDIFVKEAIARAALERAQANGDDEGVAGGTLEVSLVSFTKSRRQDLKLDRSKIWRKWCLNCCWIFELLGEIPSYLLWAQWPGMAVKYL